ncbi:MAG: lipid-A-disaccharide synthase-related protein [Scytolyngbya sp. HA4215-MV1]|jgi:uncharacterized protein (TIGR03492 family)|nr:lipid-A-disaccharide synthase-related protein [Scytolyngbya sp. HA4215-MV1]
MKLLVLSNGHGEDAIALRILQALQQHPQAPELAALPLVGEGHAYTQHGIPVIGAVKSMPSGGFIYMDGRQLARDLQGGLMGLTLAQLKTIRTWAKSGGLVLAVGDIVPLLFAWLSSAPYAFVGTAKSEYYLRDEAGWLPRRSWFEQFEGWSGSVYLPWERWLMSRPRCKAVFPRDRLTAETLKQWSIPAFDLGNPMMDGLNLDNEPSPFSKQREEALDLQFAIQNPQSKPDLGIAAAADDTLTIVLLPGSRAPEVYQNWQLILSAVAGILETFRRRSLRFVGAIAPGVALDSLYKILLTQGWDLQSESDQASISTHLPMIRFVQKNAVLVLTQHSFGQCLHAADLAIAMAGTATEQFVGLGKPAITIPGKGPQFTPTFAEAQTRLLGASVTLVKHPNQVAQTIQKILSNPDQLQIIAENGLRRLGSPGAALRIASQLMQA